MRGTVSSPDVKGTTRRDRTIWMEPEGAGLETHGCRSWKEEREMKAQAPTIVDWGGVWEGPIQNTNSSKLLAGGEESTNH